MATAEDVLTVSEVAALGSAILDEVERAVVGKRDVLTLILAGLLADGHVLLEDVPGVAKTLTARSFAQVARLGFNRIQFTPDLIPSDVTGSAFLDRESGRLIFQPGPLFANLVLGDEINRAPPKTQAAVLEAMEERQVTADGVTHQLPRPFLVLATQNPLESEGTYPLPEAQLDRFLLKISIGYPSRADEVELLRRRLQRRSDAVTLREIVDGDEVRAMQAAVETVHVGDDVLEYAVALVDATRKAEACEAGASPRGSLALVKVGRASAALQGRTYVMPQDVKDVAVAALAHRLVLRPEAWVRGVGAADVVRRVLSEVAVPPPLTDADRSLVAGG